MTSSEEAGMVSQGHQISRAARALIFMGKTADEERYEGHVASPHRAAFAGSCTIVCFSFFSLLNGTHSSAHTHKTTIVAIAVTFGQD